MKAPIDWLRIIKRLIDAGIDVQACWLGDGPLLDEMRGFVRANGMESVVSLPGFTNDRQALLARLRSWDLLLFTHVTPESPRILIESLVSGTPIVGYSSPYARRLVSGFGERCLTDVGAAESVAETLVGLYRDRESLARLTRASYEAGGRYNDVAVFRHRSQLIKQFLP